MKDISEQTVKRSSISERLRDNGSSTFNLRSSTFNVERGISYRPRLNLIPAISVRGNPGRTPAGLLATM